MCLGIPGKVIEIFDLEGTLMSRVDFGGVQQEVCIATIPDVIVDQYVMVHAGFALNILSEEEAQETLQLLNELSDFQNQQELNQ